MSNLLTASAMWANVPDEERFTSLRELFSYCEDQRLASTERQFASDELGITAEASHGVCFFSKDISDGTWC